MDQEVSSLAPASASDTVRFVTGEARRKAISNHIRERLLAEEQGRRGFRADVHRATGISTAHVSNFLNGKADLDQDGATRIVEGWWKRTLREVEDEAIGAPPDPIDEHRPARGMPSLPSRIGPSARAYDLDTAPWRELAARNASFDAWAGGYLKRASDHDEAVAGLNYAAKMLPADKTTGDVQKRYKPSELQKLADVGAALYRGEDVEEEPERPEPPPPPPSPPLPPLKERAAAAKARSR